MLRKDWNYRRGDIYLADLGEHRGNMIIPGLRPTLVAVQPSQIALQLI